MSCSRTPVCFHSLALTTVSCWWPKELVGHPIQSIFMLEFYHITLSHYGVPAPCPTLKLLRWPLELQGLGTGGLLVLTGPDSHRLNMWNRTGTHHPCILYLSKSWYTDIIFLLFPRATWDNGTVQLKASSSLLERESRITECRLSFMGRIQMSWMGVSSRMSNKVGFPWSPEDHLPAVKSSVKAVY